MPALALALFAATSLSAQTKLSTKWEELTAPDFRQGIQQAKGTCLLPFGILGKHGPHLPLGTDLLNVRYASLQAASQEYAVVFPEYYAHDQRLRAIPSRERFAVYGAHGLTAKAYHWAAKGIRHVEVSQHGKQPECLIYPDGTAVAVENSQFWGIEGLDRMLEALGVESPEQLFSMFFPT